MKSNRNNVLIFAVVFLLSLGITTTFNNCAKATYVGVSNPPGSQQTQNTNNDAAGMPNPGTGTGSDPQIPPHSDNVTVRTKTIPIKWLNSESINFSQKIKLLFIVDNSKSMTLVKERLAQSLLSLLEPLSTFQVDIKVITTTDISTLKGGEDLESQGWSYKSWTFETGSHPTGEIAQLLKAQPDETFGQYSYGEYYFLNNRNRFKFEKNDPRAQAKIDELKQNILSLIETGQGTSREQGLCNLLLALHDRSPNQFFEKNDTAGVILISDENDQSYWNTLDTTENRVACHNSYIHGSLTNLNSQNRTLSDSVDFNIYAARYQVSYKQNNDGIFEVKNRGDNGGNPLPASTHSIYVENFPTNGALACPADFFNQIILPSQISGLSSNNITNVSIEGCQVRASWSAFYNFAPDQDVCHKAFNKNGVQYTNFSEYLKTQHNMILVENSCRQTVSNSTPKRQFGLFYLLGSEDPETLREPIFSLTEQQSSIKKAILNQTQRLFGQSHFFMANIVHQTNECIKNNNEQSIGSDYINLFSGTGLEKNISTTSICVKSFDDSLKQMSLQIVKQFERSYLVDDLSSFEVITKITLVKKHLSIQLNKNQVSTSRNRISISTLVDLEDEDQLLIEIAQAQ